MGKNSNNNGRRLLRRLKLKEEEEDRLSSLPDSILTEILSRLPIKSAAATSVLSHRWRHLWTAVTRLVFHYTEYDLDIEAYTKTLNQILHKFTSPKFRVFDVDLSWLDAKPSPEASESWFRYACDRNVEQLKFHVYNDDFLVVPPYLFTSKN